MRPYAPCRLRVWLAMIALAALGASAPDPVIDVEPKSPPIDWSVSAPKIFDAIVLRPLGAVSTVVGAGAFIIAAPLGVFGPGIRQTWDVLVMTPADFTFSRPLGDF